MRPLLVTVDLAPGAFAALERLGYGIVDRRGAALGDALRDGAAAGAVGWVLEGEPCGEPELAALPALRLVACMRGGPVNVDVAAATRRGIPVLSAPGRNAEAVADFVIGQIIALVRNIARTHHLLRSGVLTERRETRVRERRDVVWRPSDPEEAMPYHVFRGPELRTLTLGLLGLGRVGERVAAKALALGMRVIAHDPFIDPHAGGAGSPLAPCGRLGEVALVGRDELLARSDVLSLHARGDGILIGEAELRAMRRGAFLVNTARGAILDYPALCAALQEGRLGGAALDVFPDEPLTPDDPLLELDTALLTPHIAGASLNVVDHYSASLVAALEALHGRGDRSAVPVANPETLAGWNP